MTHRHFYIISRIYNNGKCILTDVPNTKVQVKLVETVTTNILRPDINKCT